MIPEIKFSGFSFVGRRTKNQDAILLKKFNNDTYLFAVADGMGGHKGGEIASKIAISTLLQIIEKKLSDENDLKLLLQESFQAADTEILNQSRNDTHLMGMGTTLICILIQKNRYVWANIGDSRLYMLKDRTLNQLSDDHSYVNEVKKNTGNNVSDLVASKYSHFLTKCLDGSKSLPDVFPLGKDYCIIEKNTCFMLCSDGLIIDMTNTNISLFKNYLLGDKSIEHAAKNIIGQAFSHGSQDNISIIIIDIELKKDRPLKLQQFDYPPNDEIKNKSVSFLSKIINWNK